MEVIEGYRLVRRIGAGGMGTVHEAIDADGNRVAVKVLHAAIAADPAARQRLRREVELLHLVRGEGVAQVLDAEVDGVTAFVVTELIDGPTLEDDVRANGPLEADELAGLAHGLAGGLHAIHAAGITHRDLKPGNVMLSPRGPVIIDFGIAQVADDVRLTQTGMVTGTPGYLDPDVIAGADPGPAGDWWAWTAVLTFAATGRPPFGRGGLQAVLARVSTGVLDTEGLPDRLATVLTAALDPEPARRLPPGEVLAALDGDWDRPALRELLTEPQAPSTRTDVLPPSVPVAAAAVNTQVMPPGASDAPAQDTRVMPPGASEATVHDTRSLPPVVREPWPPPAPARTNPMPGASGAPAQDTRFMPHVVRQPWPPPAPAHVGPPPGQAGPPPGWGGMLEVPAWARPPRRRTGTVAALGAGLSALAVLVPGWWMVGAVALVVVLGAVGRGARRLRATRLRRGPRRADTARAWLGSPLHLLGAAVATLPGVLVGVVLAGGGWWVTHVLTAPPGDMRPWLLWGAAALGLWLVWTVPTAGAAREGARVVIGALPRPVRTGLVLLGLGTVAVVAVVVLTGAVPEPTWAPLPEPV